MPSVIGSLIPLNRLRRLGGGMSCIMRTMITFILLLGVLGSIATLCTVVPRWLRDRRARIDSPLSAVLVVGAMMFLGYVGLAVLGTALPDALSRLNQEEAATVRSALSGAPGCTDWPLVRVSSAVIRRDANAVEWTCSWSIIGFPQFSGVTECMDGLWHGPGFIQDQFFGNCAL